MTGHRIGIVAQNWLKLSKNGTYPFLIGSSKIPKLKTTTSMSKKSTIGLLLIVAVFALAQTVMATPPPGNNVPDAGSSSLLLGAALASLAGLRRLFRK